MVDADGPSASGEARGGRGSLWDLAPSTLLAVAEAAELVGVPRAELERRLDTGDLLFETDPRRGRDVRLVRVVDLRDAFEAAGEAQPSGAPIGPSGAPGGPSGAPDGPTQRALDREAPPSPTALAPLLSELRARLEDAERERRASTAGLLLAQRRLLALESNAQPAPWHRRSNVWTGALATVAVTALWFDLSGRLSVVGAAARDGQGAVVGATQRLGGEVDALQGRLASLVSEAQRASDEAALTRRIAESRAADEASARRADSERSEREREALLARLDELRRDAEAARATLGVERDASARERARFTERLDGAERDLERTRLAVEAERRLAAEDRAAFAARLAEAERDYSAQRSQASATLDGLAQEVEGLRAATRRADEAALRLERSTPPAAPAPWIKELLRRVRFVVGV